MVTGAAVNDYGFYRMNLNSVIDPSLHDSPDWSHVLRGRPEAAGDYEGFNFLGLGVILALIFTMPVLLERWRDVMIVIRKRPIVLIALVGFTAFALSNNIGIGLWNVHLPLPKFILTTASVFQSSGRMFWPVFYAIILAITFIIIRGYGTRVACSLLACALVVQATDTSAGWLAIRKRMMANPAAEWATPLKDLFWNRAAARYQKLRLIMPANKAATLASICKLRGATWLGHGRGLLSSSRAARAGCSGGEGEVCAHNGPFRARFSVHFRCR